MVASVHTSAAPGLVLVVDDDRDTRELYATWLLGAGFAVVQAGDGREALHMAERHHPDVVVTDVNMPQMTGPSFVERLREAGSPTPVIFLSALDAEIAEAAAAGDSCSAVVGKPCPPDTLAVIVAAALAAAKQLNAGAADSLQVARNLRKEAELLREELRKQRLR